MLGGLKRLPIAAVVSALANPAALILLQKKRSSTSRECQLPSVRLNLKRESKSMGYDNPEGSGAVFFQANKKNDKAPDWKGKFTWQGQELELAMWERKAKSDNQAYLAFKVGVPFAPQKQYYKVPPRNDSPIGKAETVEPGPNDDIPF